MCKFWKVNGYATERKEGEAHSARSRRFHADRDIEDFRAAGKEARDYADA